MKTLVFYAGLLYGEYEYAWHKPFAELRGLPDGAYIFLREKSPWDTTPGWYLSDFTPVLLADVPKELLTLVLLLT